MKLAITGIVGDQPRIWPIEGPFVRIGRGRSNAVQIPYRSVSREHAEIRIKGDRLLLRDLQSRNGTLLNGSRVRKSAEVRAGDSIQVGAISLHVTEWPPENLMPGNDLSDLTLSIGMPMADVLGSEPRVSPDPGILIRLLEKTGRLLVQHRSLQYTCEEFLRVVEMALPTSRLFLFLRPDLCGKPIPIASRTRGSRGNEPLILSEASLQAVLDRRTPAITAGVGGGAHAGRRDKAASSGGHSAVAVPLLYEGRAHGLLYADHDDPEFRYGRESLEVLTLFANMAAARVANDRLMDSEKKHAQIDQELAMASRIQRWLLPAHEPLVEGYEIHARLESCEEVGGDFYDFQPAEDGTVWLMLGDVKGKGICAAIIMSLVLSSARVLYSGCAGPGVLANRLSTILAQRTDVEQFVTAFIGKLEPAAGVLHYVNAGHPAPLILHDRSTRKLDSTGVPLRVVPDFEYRHETVELDPGALLAVFTDGVPEARRGRRQEFFGDRRVEDAVRAAARSPHLDEACQRIVREVDAFLSGAPRPDDIALLLVRRARASQVGAP